MADFRLWSDKFPTNGFMPKAHEYNDKAFGVDGENISPALSRRHDAGARERYRHRHGQRA